MKLNEKVLAAASLSDKAIVIWDHYQSRKLNNELEPLWTHAAYELIHKYIHTDSLEPDDIDLIYQIINSHELKDGHAVSIFPGRPNGPKRIIHDGWKAGTPTWIFMGRNESKAEHIGEGWIITNRTLPSDLYAMMDSNLTPDTLWLAYNIDQQMGITAKDANCVGPAVDRNQLIKAVELKIGKTLHEEL